MFYSNVFSFRLKFNKKFHQLFEFRQSNFKIFKYFFKKVLLRMFKFCRYFANVSGFLHQGCLHNHVIGISSIFAAKKRMVFLSEKYLSQSQNSLALLSCNP